MLSIGFAIARRLGLEGAQVSISSRNQLEVDRALSELQNSGITAMGSICDFTQESHRKQLVELVDKQFGGIDILVPNCTIYTPFDGLGDEKDWDDTFNPNLKDPFLLTKEALPILLKKPSSKIIYLSSIASYRPQETFAGPYSIAKTAVIGLTKMLSWQLAQKGVSVNAVALGLIDTKPTASDDQLLKKHTEQIPMKRYGTANDVAGAVAFLASEDASYITGEIIVVGGGMASRL